MKKTISLLTILLAILLVSCQDEAPKATETPQPTVAAEDTPVEEASPEGPEATVAPEPTVGAEDAPTEEAMRKN